MTAAGVASSLKISPLLISFIQAVPAARYSMSQAEVDDQGSWPNELNIVGI
jgi:hypothetical protein